MASYSGTHTTATPRGLLDHIAAAIKKELIIIISINVALPAAFAAQAKSVSMAAALRNLPLTAL